jgi:uncharacterized protein with NRDE domain
VCTLALFWRVFPDAPLVVAANRDENPARPWREPHRWPDGMFAGRDEVAGGTWLGLRGDLVCGITNRWGPANDPSRRSRGHVVHEALLAGSAAAAAHALASASPTATNAFGLLVADAQDAFRVDCNGSTISSTALLPGITVLANWGADERWPRSERALALAHAVPTTSVTDAWPALERLVADHEGAEVPGQAICVHGERYATVCSTLISIEAVRRWRDTRGNPCTAPWIEREV